MDKWDNDLVKGRCLVFGLSNPDIIQNLIDRGASFVMAVDDNQNRIDSINKRYKPLLKKKLMAVFAPVDKDQFYRFMWGGEYDCIIINGPEDPMQLRHAFPMLLKNTHQDTIIILNVFEPSAIVHWCSIFLKLVEVHNREVAILVRKPMLSNSRHRRRGAVQTSR